MIVTYDYVKTTHQELESDKRCFPGIKEENLLRSAIDGQYWYNTPLDQIIHVAYSICAGHVFSDGNKRTSFLVLKLLETKLGLMCDWPSIAQAILDLATYSTPKEDFAAEIKNCILF